MNAVRPLDVSDAATAQAVVVLQREAYAVEAALIGSNGIPALTQSLEAVQAAGEDWLGMSDGEGLLVPSPGASSTLARSTSTA